MWNSKLSYNKHIESNSVLVLIITFVEENIIYCKADAYWADVGNVGVFRNGSIADNLLHIRLVKTLIQLIISVKFSDKK